MNYKIFIFLIILVLMMVLIYRELTTYKEDMMTSLRMEYAQTKSQLESTLIKCVTQIKSISNDNLQQFRKISQLNSQTVKKIHNHFTEDDDSANYTDVINLSDAKPKKPIDIALYMSDENDHSRPSNPETDECPDGMCRVGIPIYEYHEQPTRDATSMPIYDTQSEQVAIPADYSEQPESVKQPEPVKQQKKPLINIQTNIQADNVQVDVPVKNGLLPVDGYKYKELQDMAKKMGLACTHKGSDGKMRIYKKNELYEKLVENIKNI